VADAASPRLSPFVRKGSAVSAMARHPAHRSADLLVLLAIEHRDLDASAERLLAADDDRWVRHLPAYLVDLATHELAEQHLVTPLVVDRLDGGGELATRRIAEEDRLLAVAEEVRGTARTEASRELLADLRRRVSEHSDREELEVFPRLRHVVTPDELRELARTYRSLAIQTPTRWSVGPTTGSLTDRVRKVQRDLLAEFGHPTTRATSLRTDQPWLATNS
jgi:hemerythrin superfamily protein